MNSNIYKHTTCLASMARQLLTDVLTQKIPWEEFNLWLNPGEKSDQNPCGALSCNRGDFVIYFINLLHDDAESIIKKSQSGSSCSKKHGASTTEKGSSTNERRDEHFPILCKTHLENNVNNVNACSTRSSFHASGGRSFHNKSMDSDIANRSFPKPQTLPNGLIGSNYNNQLNDSMVTPEKRNNLLSHVEVQREELFLNNCPLSPITTDMNAVKSRNVGYISESDSPNNRIIHKDNRWPGSNKKRASYGRATSSPSNSSFNSSFNISEHSFPAIASPAKSHSSQKRRIKPTRLADSFDKSKSFENNSGHSFGQVVRPTEPSTPFKEEVCMEDCMDIRELLRIEKQKMQHSQHFNPTASQNSCKAPVEASPECVKSASELLILANIYSLLWDTNQISNIITELNFVLTLLTVQAKILFEESENRNNPIYFVTMHECVYFATAVLNNQRNLLSVLDNASLKFLVDNSRIALFTPKLQQHIQAAYENRRKSKNLHYSVPSEFPGSVSFQSDTDNRENFPSEVAFCTFRKQRDSFYEILSKWEDNHTSPGWSFSASLGQAVRNLLNINNEPANFIHFARLFRSQLLGSCHKTANLTDDEVNDETVEVLRCLKEGNPDKYSRLFERLVTPFKSSSCNALPEFSGKQEFYRDFIVCGAHAIFNTHLIDSLWHEILNLNTSNFTASEVEEGATCVDFDTRQSFVACVRNLQLLAKFLGFVVFLPYQTSNSVSEPIAISQSTLRIQIQPQIDVLSCLKAAIESRNLILTVPWIVQYLSMVDSVSLRLEYYRDIINILYLVYRSLPACRSINFSGCILLRVSLGWLFELPQFPENSFYTWCLNKENIGEKSTVMKDPSMAAGVDELDLIDWHCLQALCPSLESVKWLLLSDTNHMSNPMVPPRHITPLPVAKEPKTEQSSAKVLQLHLEDSFLGGQPRSVRTTIEFVSQRIASSCVKHVCGKPLQEVKERISKLAAEISNPKDKEEVSKVISCESLQCAKDLRTHCEEEVPTFCLKKCSAVLPLLFAEDMPDRVTELCIEIAVRTCIEKVNLWINSHITPALFAKDFKSEIQKIQRNAETLVIKSAHVLSPGWKDTADSDGIASPPEAIRNLRRLLWRVMQREVLEQGDVLHVLETVHGTLSFRNDLIASAERVLGSLSVDLVLALVTHQPQLIDNDFLDAFLKVWKCPEVDSCYCFERVICPRNVMMFSNSNDKCNTWSAAAKLLVYLLKHELISASKLETECVTLFQQDWPPETLKHIASCLEEVVTVCKKGRRDTGDSFVLMLELVSELCQDMEPNDL